MAAAQSSAWRFSYYPTAKTEQRRTATAYRHSTVENPMSLSIKGLARTAAETWTSKSRTLPVLLFDVMDTLVRDPFYHHVPDFFGLSMKELIECKHPTAWIDFEKGLIDEVELAQTFFKDGRPVDLKGLKNCMRQGYSYIEGVEELLIDLKRNGYEIHTATNYPMWYELIEEKLKISTYLSWTFCSCVMGKRKPDLEFYMDMLKCLDIKPACCIFIDDRMKNVEAAIDAGFIGIQFKDADSLRWHLTQNGVVCKHRT